MKNLEPLVFIAKVGGEQKGMRGLFGKTFLDTNDSYLSKSTIAFLIQINGAKIHEKQN